MKQFELTLIYRPPDAWQPKSLDKIEADDLLEVLAQLLLVVVKLQKKIDAELFNSIDDDIPF